MQDTNTQHIHDETKILPLQEHLKLNASQIRQKAHHSSHPLQLSTHKQTPRYKPHSTLHTTIVTTPITKRQHILHLSHTGPTENK